MKILLVDDDPTTRKILGLYLKANGLEVVSAENGLDALEKLGLQSVDLIMSDVNMPYMDGIEFVKTIRTSGEWAAIPVLMVSTESTEEDKDLAYAAGANAYLIKPVTAEILIEAIRKLEKTILVKGGTHNA